MRTRSENLALYDQYRSYIQMVAGGLKKRYFVRSLDLDDWDQICTIGGWAAVVQWNPSVGPFEPFARCVITRLVQAVVESATRQCRAGSQKEIQISQLRTSTDDEAGDEVFDFGDVCTGLQSLERQWAYEDLVIQVGNDSTEIELRAIVLKAEGYSYEEISQLTGLGEKQIDNALSRIRKKLRRRGIVSGSNP